MKIILKKDVDKLGEKDEVVNVADGYARNYLFPRNLANTVTKPALAAAEKRRAKREEEIAAQKVEWEKLAEKINEAAVVIVAESGEEGKLFGSVTTQDIVLAVKEKADIDLEKKKVDLREPIKALGEYEVPVKLFKGVTAKIKVNVKAKKAA